MESLRMLWFRESIPRPRDEEVEDATDWLESCLRMDTVTGSTSVSVTTGGPDGWTLGPGTGLCSSKLTLLGDDITETEEALLCLESDLWNCLTFSGSKSAGCGMSRNCCDRCDADLKLTDNDLVDFLESVRIIKLETFHGALGGSISKA